MSEHSEPGDRSALPFEGGRPAAHARQQVGAIALFAGIAVFGLILVDTMIGLPLPMPASWYQNRALWGFLGLGLFALGWKLQRSAPDVPAEWNPGPPGRRFRRVVVYSRADCHLCDDAKDILANYVDYLPNIEEVDIDTDPDLQQRFGTSVPVVQFDDQIRFRGKVDVVLLRRLLEGTEPLPRCAER